MARTKRLGMSRKLLAALKAELARVEAQSVAIRLELARLEVELATLRAALAAAGEGT